MSKRLLRPKPRISYQELEEPSFDEYVYCVKCGDYVYEYCSIHGPLLVIPDNKVPKKQTSLSAVPHADLTLPNVFLQLGISSIPGAGLGIFAKLTLPKDVRFGPFCGKCTKQVNSAYCWQLYDGNKKPLHRIDGSDIAESNWMRYVNCARHYREQNLVAYQYQGEIYYRTIKIIPRSTELLVFYGSQYAEALGIDLRKYNAKNQYHAAIGIDPPSNGQNKAIETIFQHNDIGPVTSTTSTIEIARADNSHVKTEDFMIEDHFQYIDDTFITSEDVCQKIGENQAMVVELNFQNQYKEFRDKQNSHELNDTQIARNTQDQIIQVDLISESKLTFNDLPSLSSNIQKQRLNNMHHSNILSSIKNEEIKIASTKFTQITNEEKVAWKCNICERILTKTSLRKHSQIHSKVKTYKCSICEFGSHEKYGIDRHMLSHSQKKYKCEMCPYEYNIEKYFKKHVQRMHVNRPNCDLCQYKVNNSVSMENHRSLHGQKNVMKCEFCGYLCMKTKYLKRHVIDVHK